MSSLIARRLDKVRDEVHVPLPETKPHELLLAPNVQ
jgi:hypothetical protein